MSQLSTLKLLLEKPQENDEILNFYLDCAKDIICEIRNSDIVESKYLTAQIEIAIELYNKRGAEGQTGHGEIGVTRTFGSSNISPDLLSKITPVARTPYSQVRVITS